MARRRERKVAVGRVSSWWIVVLCWLCSDPSINDKWMAFTGKRVACLRKRDLENCRAQKNITWRRWASPIHTRLLRAWWCRCPTSNTKESSPCSSSRLESSCLRESVGDGGSSGRCWWWLGYESSSRTQQENENKWVEIINSLNDNGNCNWLIPHRCCDASWTWRDHWELPRFQRVSFSCPCLTQVHKKKAKSNKKRVQSKNKQSINQ